MSFLRIQNISHTYFTKKSAKTALSSISLDIEEGSFISFLGPSGCGKTTLLSIISGLLNPSSGQVLVEGRPIQEAEEPLIGYMLQQDYLFPWKTIEENILLGLRILNKSNEISRKKTFRLLKEIGLEGTENQYPKQLSGGMKQRVALVRTLAADPKLLLLDEPFSALDFQTKLRLEDLVSATLKSFGKTAILVTHDIGEAIAMSDTICLFSSNPGQIYKQISVPEQLRNLTPFEARAHPEYASLFQTVWKELENLEK
ncbi:NitT/TauT family transport system ATP-binding protein [Peribacillus deserti]|uniref:NitT/TauT family transport system ATP-binding protein n=1 Tax=Peribacillus deserti TaxID=673318 RepID=A0ABS2QJR9_9BACI|nr:ABC transporter ATP-binding protein [Peribacillus deserti]MBM7692974.1 NitT/TauT family transport system ATP-binding protein [Peribacillus deserti]